MTKEKARKKAEMQAKKDSVKSADRYMGKAGERMTKEKARKKDLRQAKKDSAKAAARQIGRANAQKSMKRKADKPVDPRYKGPEASEAPGKMPDGYNMKRPAEKLGYIQKLGAGRMSPGKMGDMTAMKMMHGDAAAKYYDGAGMYMNGAPKYEGASKSYMGAMKHVAGHEEPGSDRPSYTKSTTTTKVTPGTSSSKSTTTSGGGSQSKTKLEKAKSGSKTKMSDSDYMSSLSKNKKFKGRTGSEMAEAGHISKSKISAYDKIAGTSSSGGSTSSKSTTSKSTKPTVKSTTEKKKVTSKVAGQSEMKSSFAEKEANRKARYKAGRAEVVNLAKRDSANVAQKYLANKPLTKENIMEATQRGEFAGNKRVRRGAGGEGSFGEKNAEFRFSREEANELFNPRLGTAQVNVTKGTKKTKKGTEFTRSHPTYKKSYTQGDVGKEVSFGKKGKGKATITSVSSQTGSQGSYGGFDTAEGYMKSMKPGSPKMPKGPMKFGMRK